MPAYTPSANAIAAAAQFRDNLANSTPPEEAQDVLPPKAMFDAFAAYMPGGGGGVASVTGAAPITSTGGANPVLGFALTVSAKAGAFTAAAGTHYRCTGATYAATLPAGGSNVGRLISIKNASATAVTVTCAVGDLIDDVSATLPLVAGECALLVGHSSGWDLV